MTMGCGGKISMGGKTPMKVEEVQLTVLTDVSSSGPAWKHNLARPIWKHKFAGAAKLSFQEQTENSRPFKLVEGRSTIFAAL